MRVRNLIKFVHKLSKHLQKRYRHLEASTRTTHRFVGRSRNKKHSPISIKWKREEKKILATSRDKVNKLNELRSKKTINENEYNEAVQNSELSSKSSEKSNWFNICKSILGVQESNSILQAKISKTIQQQLQIRNSIENSTREYWSISKYMDPNKTVAENTFCYSENW